MAGSIISRGPVKNTSNPLIKKKKKKKKTKNKKYKQKKKKKQINSKLQISI